MNATQITPRMVLNQLAAIAESDGRIADKHAHWKLGTKMGLTPEQTWMSVCKLKRLGYIEDRVVLIAPGTTTVFFFITGKN